MDEGIVYKKRGIGMFVADGALGYLKKKRRKDFYQDYIVKMLDEGKKLGIATEEIIKMIQQKGENY